MSIFGSMRVKLQQHLRVFYPRYGLSILDGDVIQPALCTKPMLKVMRGDFYTQNFPVFTLQKVPRPIGVTPSASPVWKKPLCPIIIESCTYFGCFTTSFSPYQQMSHVKNLKVLPFYTPLTGKCYFYALEWLHRTYGVQRM